MLTYIHIYTVTIHTKIPPYIHTIPTHPAKPSTITISNSIVVSLLLPTPNLHPNNGIDWIYGYKKNWSMYGVDEMNGVKPTIYPIGNSSPHKAIVYVARGGGGPRKVSMCDWR